MGSFVLKKLDFYKYLTLFIMLIEMCTYALYLSGVGPTSLFSSVYSMFYKAGPIVLAGLYILAYKGEVKVDEKFKLLLSGFVMLGVLLLISLVQMAVSKQSNANLLSGLGTLLWPLLTGFFAFSLLDQESLHAFMKIFLIISFVTYILSIGGLSSITVSALLSISFSESYSPFESHGFPGMASVLATYFTYYRKEKKDRKYLVLSLIFVFLCFKRTSIIFGIIRLLVSFFSRKKDEPVSRKVMVITVIGFTVAGVLYSYIMNPVYIQKFSDLLMNLFGLDATQLTMTRDTLYSNLLHSGFVSAGLDSTWLYSKNIEMDLVKLYLEVGIVGLFAVVAYFWQYGRVSWYAYINMFSVFFNLLVSHSLHTVSGWTIRYLLLFALIYYKSDCPPCRVKRKRELYDGGEMESL